MSNAIVTKITHNGSRIKATYQNARGYSLYSEVDTGLHKRSAHAAKCLATKYSHPGVWVRGSIDYGFTWVNAGQSQGLITALLAEGKVENADFFVI